MGLAKLIYSTSLLTISKPLINRIDKIIFNFIWEGKTPKIKKKTIIAEIKHGGLKMIDFEIMERSLKIAWIDRFVYVIAWARGQLRINFTRIFKVFTKLPESRSDEGNLENFENASEVNP